MFCKNTQNSAASAFEILSHRGTFLCTGARFVAAAEDDDRLGRKLLGTAKHLDDFLRVESDDWEWTYPAGISRNLESPVASPGFGNDSKMMGAMVLNFCRHTPRPHCKHCRRMPSSRRISPVWIPASYSGLESKSMCGLCLPDELQPVNPSHLPRNFGGIASMSAVIFPKI
ncbi:hypothetical protein AVEN_155199-1 [Araneus ventricosus]|uniref:Uncharacterized protein n=1 Tax=Araneus ventricosus TaxID=182803 RepID=A0A4Y2S5W9_ARAVE|nr:hypothetical protein AVEN_155199-1 [Araneus ventricosus]